MAPEHPPRSSLCKQDVQVNTSSHCARSASAETGAIRIYEATGANEPIATVNVHRAPVYAMAYNPVAEAVVSSDSKGRIEYWSTKEG